MVVSGKHSFHSRLEIKVAKVAEALQETCQMHGLVKAEKSCHVMSAQSVLSASLVPC